MAKYKIIPSSRTIVRSPISIGHKAEKGVEAIEFDLTAWVETYGSGTLTVIMRRWGDAIPYPIALEIDENNKATWTLSDIDTAKAGMAYAQLNYIVGETVVKKSDIYTFRVMDSLTGEGEPPEAYESWLEHLTHLAAEAMAEVLDIEGIVTDKTLTVDGGIADAKATGDALAEIKADLGDLDELETTAKTDLVSAINEAASSGGSGLTVDIKQALLACFAHVAWDGEDPTGQTYIDTLEDALYPPTNISRITAVYTQSGSVYNTDSLNSLKNDLVVTAIMSDNTTQTVVSYTLSGQLVPGQSTITVSYAGKTTTFTVTVSYRTYDYITLNGYKAGQAMPVDNGLLTDISMSSDYILETSLLYPAATNSYAIPVMGIRNGDVGTKEFGLFFTANTGKVGYWYGNVDTVKTINALVADQLNSIIYQPVGVSQAYPANATVNVNGTDYDIGATVTGETWHPWLGVFKYGISETSTSAKNTDRFGGQKVGDIIIKTTSNTVLHHLKPATDGEHYGMVDTVTNRFYYNANYANKYVCGNWS